MKIYAVIHIIFVFALSFSEIKNDQVNLNNSFMFKPMLLSEENGSDNVILNKAEPCSTIFSVNEEPEISSFQEQFKDYPFILYLDDIYQSVYRYSNLNTVIFENENNNLYLFSRYDFNKNKIKFSIKYNFK